MEVAGGYMGAGEAAGTVLGSTRGLYQAAGAPTLASLVNAAAQQLPPARVSDTTLSDWLNGKGVPSRRNSRAFMALVALLQGKAKNHRAYEPRSEGWWQRLLKHAQDERNAAQREGRPPRPSDPDDVRDRPGQQTTRQPMARSAYLEQVRRIAPPSRPGLIDRDAEMADLAKFCLDPEGASYAWWQAGPWAGKSALLSTFVLFPPAEVAGRVQIVSYFVTARLAAQDTRESFTDVVLEQLAALLGQPLPPVLPETIREAYLLDLMSQAANRCHDTGRRLILLVDGLDEDRGITTGPDAHSIAGLLPSDPSAGMRVIVAGRPDPPVPDDVSGWHPLRDPKIVRRLSESLYARDVQQLAKQELKRLLHGTPAQQDALGLVAAARGGLSARDLAELADIPMWEVEDILYTAAGRTFRSRPSRHDIDDRPDLYLLGHEELQAAAREYLGGRLAGYRNRLHSWAESYRALRWPPETPEYLLSGYFRLLEEQGDLTRMVECCLDRTRHDRMLDVTGGDDAALTETRTALNRVTSQDHPELASALALAYYRDRLTERNANIPIHLPAVWAAMGQLPRAKAVARSITSPWDQTYALVEIADTLVQAGRQQDGAEVAMHAEAVARSIREPFFQTSSLARVAESLARTGEHHHAVTIASTCTNPHSKALALANIAENLAEANQCQETADIAMQAEAVARSISDPYQQARALAGIAPPLARAGQYQHAEALARAITYPNLQTQALAEIVQALAKAGRHQDAEVVARAIVYPSLQVHALAEIASTLACAGQYRYADEVLRSGRGSRQHHHRPGVPSRRLG